MSTSFVACSLKFSASDSNSSLVFISTKEIKKKEITLLILKRTTHTSLKKKFRETLTI